MPQRSWSRAWKTYPWLRLLSGTTSKPSTVQSGVERWISSLRDTPASPSPSPGSVVAWMTPGTSGPMSRASSESQGQLGLSSRTSPAISTLDSERSAESFAVWVSRLRQEYSARRKWGRRTDENGCSPWATATANDGHRPGSDATSTQGRNLKREAENWPTATTMDTMEAARSGIVGNHNLSLPVAAKEWATPTSRDHKDGACDLERNPVNGLLGRQVLVPTGQESPPASGPRRLNPAFVEWLMGLPHGWTDFAPVETEWSRWQQLMRSELSRLPWLDS